MKRTKNLTVALLCFLVFPSISFSQDKLITVLNDEVQREMQFLKSQETPAYFISYRVEETSRINISSSLGALTSSTEPKSNYLTVMVRAGSKDLDNYHQVRGSSNNSSNSLVSLPLDNDPLSTKQAIWGATNDAYQQAVATFSKVKANVAVKVDEEDKSPDFSDETPNTFTEPVIKIEDLKIDKSSIEKRLKKYSALFLKDSAIFNGTSTFSCEVTRKYYVSSNGDKIAQTNTMTQIVVSASIKAKDGMVLPLQKTFRAFRPDDLPSDDKITAEINRMVKTLTALKVAPVAEPYSGPALLSSAASGVFFHEIFGHRVEGQRMKNESDAQTFKKKIKEQVLLPSLNVYSDPQLKSYASQDLTGYYLYDDQGEKGQKVSIVENGILKNFLMSRTPINGFPNSNGHGRSMYGMQPASRQSNLIAETIQPQTKEEMRKELIKLAKEQNKPYGYLFDEVIGGFTTTGRYSPNAFNVTPTIVYRVYTDGQPDELVRGVNLIGTPLSMFSQIVQAGDKSEIFNGICGAESGSVPVSATSPMLLVKQIETQKKAKSMERSIILPRPDGLNNSK